MLTNCPPYARNDALEVWGLIGHSHDGIIRVAGRRLVKVSSNYSVLHKGWGKT
jgi:hypothetical protein